MGASRQRPRGLPDSTDDIMNFQTGNLHRAARTAAWICASALALAACNSGGGGEPPAPSAQFIRLGMLPGYTSSQAFAVSANGSTVAGTVATAAGNAQAFRWTAQAGVNGLGFLPGGGHSTASGVSADGSVVVGNGDTSSDPASPTSGLRWTAAAGMVRVDPVAGSYLCTAGGVSGDGAAIVGTCLTFNNEGYKWTAGTGALGLGRFGGGSNQTSTASAIAANGGVIVGAGHPVLTGAVMWNASGVATILGKLPGDSTAGASAVSRDGTVIVGTSTDAAQVARAFRWTQATGMVALAATAGNLLTSFATGVSGDGATVVGWATNAAGETAVVWDAAHGLRPLAFALATDYQTDIAGWSLTRATAVSDDGHTIAGYGVNPQGQTEAWIVRLPG
jgi:probable HAF family extracellular repeat protein